MGAKHRLEAFLATDPCRTVLLSSRPLDNFINATLSALGTRQELANPCISWSPFQPPPLLSENIYFATHLAVGVVDTNVWEDTSRSWIEKFQHVCWWEHLGAVSGSSGPATGGAGRTWQEEEIARIQAVEVLGITPRTNEGITVDVYDRLFPTWVYLPIWWNCQDFAVRLAFLLVQTPWATQRLVLIARQLKEDVVMQILPKWQRQKRSMIASLPIWLPGAGVFLRRAILANVSSYTTGLITDDLQGADIVGLRKWLDNIVTLGNAIEELKTFHHKFFWEWNTEVINIAGGVLGEIVLAKYKLSVPPS